MLVGYTCARRVTDGLKLLLGRVLTKMIFSFFQRWRLVVASLFMHTKLRSTTLILGVLIWIFISPIQAQTPGAISIKLDHSQVILEWDSVVGRNYQVLSTSDLRGPWVEIHTEPSPLVATTERLAYALSVSPQAQFYRVAEEPDFTPDAMAWISPGTFTMGSPEDEANRRVEEGPQTVVTLTRGFWMGKHTVTQGAYESVIGNNPSSVTGDPNRPVEQVTWNDAVAYCEVLTQRERAAGRIPANWAYRLPTEAEWEYACRAGSTTRFSYGDDFGHAGLADYGWYSDNSEHATHPVGQKLPNAWGLYDMHGNVEEWCHDLIGPYPGGEVTDPEGPTTGVPRRVVRGGFYNSFAWDCRSARRSAWGPDVWRFHIGFRVVVAVVHP